MKLTVVGCSGSFRPRLGLLELPRGGRRLPAAPRPGQRRPRRAAAPLRSLRPRRDLPEPSARRPLHRHVRVLRGPLLPARGRPLRGDARVRPRGRRAAADHGVRGHPVRHVDERGLRLPHPEVRPLRPRPLHGAHGTGLPPRRGVRHPHRARRQGPDVLRRHRGVRRPRHPGGGQRPFSCARRPSRTARRTSRSCTSTAGRPVCTRRAPGRSGWCSRTSRRGRTASRTWRTPAPSTPGPAELARPGAVYEL